MRTIMIVGGELLQVTTVQIAKEMGLRTIVTGDSPDDSAQQIADEAIRINKRDVGAHIRLAKERKRELAGVFTAGASVECTVAEAADAAGLPGLDPVVAHQIANKSESRNILWKAGIPQPAFQCLYAENHFIRCIAQGIGYPLVVKPTDSSGSRGVTIVRRAEDLTDAVIDKARAISGDNYVILEQYLEPRQDTIAEQSVETVWYQGKGYWLNWVDRPFLPNKKYAIERGHINPAMHDAETQKQVEEMVLAAGKALGMTTGIFKADVMLTKDGPRILETTARLSGGFDSAYTSPLAHGVDYIKGAMKLALGEPIDWNCFLPKQYRHAVAMAKFPLPGRITGFRGIETARFLHGVDYVFVRRQVGDVIPPITDCVERPVFVIASGDSRDEALDAADMALAMIHVDTEAV